MKEEPKIVPYCLKRSLRRSMAIQITKEGEVVVRAPYGVSEAEIEAFLHRKMAWIITARERVLAEQYRREREQNAHYFDGALFPLHGGTIPIRYVRKAGAKQIRAAYTALGERNAIEIRGDQIDEDACKMALQSFGKKYAKTYLGKRTEQLAAAMGITYNKVTIKDTKTRWGSCSAEGNLNLHWKLIMMPERISDYVLIHELCHRREMNHSQAFWALVGSYLPDYAMRRNWLKQNGTKYMEW